MENKDSDDGDDGDEVDDDDDVNLNSEWRNNKLKMFYSILLNFCALLLL